MRGPPHGAKNICEVEHMFFHQYMHINIVHLLKGVKHELVGFSLAAPYLGYPEHTLSTRRPLAFPLTWEGSTQASSWSASDVTSRPLSPIGSP